MADAGRGLPFRSCQPRRPRRGHVHPVGTSFRGEQPNDRPSAAGRPPPFSRTGASAASAATIAATFKSIHLRTDRRICAVLRVRSLPSGAAGARRRFASLIARPGVPLRRHPAATPRPDGQHRPSSRPTSGQRTPPLARPRRWLTEFDGGGQRLRRQLARSERSPETAASDATRRTVSAPRPSWSACS